MQVSWRTLAQRAPDSRLGRLAQLKPTERRTSVNHYEPKADEHFFERPPCEADLLYDYFVTGDDSWESVHQILGAVHSTHLCKARLIEFVAYWQLPPAAVGICAECFTMTTGWIPATPSKTRQLQEARRRNSTFSTSRRSD